MKADDRFFEMPGPTGNPMWLDLQTDFVYEILLDTPFGDSAPICCTSSICGPLLHPRVLRCPGEMPTSESGPNPTPHCHRDGVPEDYLRRSARHFAMLNFCAIHGRRLTVSQFAHLFDFYTEGFGIVEEDPNTISVSPDDYNAAADRRAPYPVEEDGSDVTGPMTTHRVASISAAIELNTRYIYERFGRVLDKFLPPIDFGYPGIRDEPIPDSCVLYEMRYSIPGSSLFNPSSPSFSLFISTYSG